MLPRLASLLEMVRKFVRPGSKILEIGPGEGTLAFALVEAGYEVVAIEREPRSHFPILMADFQTHDFGGMLFDCVVASLVLHHIPDLEAAVRKVRAILQPLGIVLIDDYGWERLDPTTAQQRWADSWHDEFKEWKMERRDLHTSAMMLEVLNRHFVNICYRNHAYFDDGAAADLLGFSFVGRPKIDDENRAAAVTNKPAE